MYRLNDALIKIAEEYHETPEQILKNVQEAIDAGFHNPDPAVQEAWSRIPYSGTHPEAGEFLQLLADMLLAKEYAS